MHSLGREFDHRSLDDLPDGEAAGNSGPLKFQFSAVFSRQRGRIWT
jgi:hypothetical protein